METKFVVLVEVPKYLDIFHLPKVGEYNNPYIRKIIPCTLENGEYKSWENGKKIKKNSQMFEWKLFVGTMFRFNNRREVLLTRDLKGNNFLTTGVKFNPSTMVRYDAK